MFGDPRPIATVAALAAAAAGVFVSFDLQSTAGSWRFSLCRRVVVVLCLWGPFLWWFLGDPQCQESKEPTKIQKALCRKQEVLNVCTVGNSNLQEFCYATKPTWNMSM